MNKVQIQQLLSQQKINSISEIICFVIQQVNKTLSHEPFEEICLRLTQLEKPKGLDVVMIEEVKTLCEAMIDQRQQNLRDDFDRTLNDHWQHIEHAVNNLNSQNAKNTRQSLAQVDILNFLNTNSFNTGFQQDMKKTNFQDELRKNRDSFKETFSKQISRDNLTNDCDRLKQTLQTERKQINDMKYSLMQINRQISNKITIEEAHTIISEFENRMYHKIQNEKLQLQKIEFGVKKQLQEQILKVRKEAFIDIDFQGLRKDLINIKKTAQKVQRKLQKYREQTKSLSKTVKSLQTTFKENNKALQAQKFQFQKYCNFNNSKNDDLAIILEQINEKLTYFDKIDKLDSKINTFSSQFAKGHWSTECKTKNQSIVWEKQISNSSPNIFKFQTQKSQILIQEPGTYLIEFTLFECKTTHISGSVWIQSLALEPNRKEIKATGSNSLKFVAEIQQKSILMLKLIGGQNNGTIGGKGILKISKY